DATQRIPRLANHGCAINANVFKRVNAAYPYGVRLWDEDTGNTLEIRLCKSLDDAIYSARGAMCSQHASRVAEFIAAGGGPEARERLLRRLRTEGRWDPQIPNFRAPAAPQNKFVIS